MLELREMPNDTAELAAERRALRDAQILDFLSEMSPVEFPVRPVMRRGAQSVGLLLRPKDDILVVELFRIHHARSRRVTPVTNILHKYALWKNSPSDRSPTTRG
jgi:hypothetical protein